MAQGGWTKSIDNSLFLQDLCVASLEEGRCYVKARHADLAAHDDIGNLLADEALKQLYNPFLSLKLAELLTFFGEITAHTPSHALGLKAKGDAFVQIRHHQAAIECLDAAGEAFLGLGDEGNWAREAVSVGCRCLLFRARRGGIGGRGSCSRGIFTTA